MNYSKLLSEYIEKSNLSLGEIAKRIHEEKGIKIDRSYISMLKNNKTKNPASEEVNRAIAEVTGGDPDRLIWAAWIEKSEPGVREALMLINDNVITKAMKLTQKFPGYFYLTEEEQEKIEEDPDVRSFWDSLGDSIISNISSVSSHVVKPNQTLKEELRMKAEKLAGKKELVSGYLDIQESIKPFDPNSMQRIPILGSIQAGTPIEMIEDNEGYTLVDPNILNGKEGFALKVKGDSMIGDRIHDGDIVIVAKQEEIHSHEIAVVAVNGDHATLKRVKLHGDMCMLVPSNPTMEPQLIPAKDVHILGKVVEVKFQPK